MARLFAVAFEVRMVVEADDAEGARTMLYQGVEDIAAAHETASDVDACPEASAVVAALEAALFAELGADVRVQLLREDGAA